MKKCLFLAGASGAIGKRLAPLLVADGWRVVGSTRSAGKVPLLRDMGVEPAVVDVFDAASLRNVVAEAQPEVVMHQLTDLPHALEASKMAEALVRNARLREQGTRNLISAAVAAGARRLIAQSIAFVYADGPLPHREEDPLLPLSHPVHGETTRGVMSLERQVLDAPLEGVVLRYGFFYGPGTGFEAPTGPGSVHVDAAAWAAVLAITRAVPGIYNVAEADGTVTTDKAARILAWDSSWRPARPVP
jgi:nucleoside-diphosphate-sugar epimerase